MSKYKFIVKTKDQHLAGTDSSIFVRLYGERGISNEVRTNPYIKKNAYERNKQDVFEIPFDSDYGDIYKIEVRSDMMYSSPAWFCEYFKVSKVGSKHETYFGIDKWIDKKDSVYSFNATSGFVAILPDAEKEYFEFVSTKHYIPPNLEMEISCSTRWMASVEYSEIKVTEISTGVSVEVEYMAVKLAVETKLNNSLKQQIGQNFQQEVTKETKVIISASDKPRVLKEIWTEQVLNFRAQLGMDYFTFKVPSDRVFSGFKEEVVTDKDSVFI